MTAAQYPDHLSFQQRTLVTQDSGQQVEIWETVFSRYGMVKQTAAGESVQNDQHQSTEVFDIRFPFDTVASQLTSLAWRVIWKNQMNATKRLFLTGVDVAVNGRSPEITLTATG